ncbi:transcriptional repressor NrdR [Candidatus Saccharibacteria bacterium]|nr:transcriptional repressor NrdR [Candidatus Saccharibacteria bacterium]
MPKNLRIGDSKVLESRETPDGTMIRRRRITSDGKYRFTTYERIERQELTVRKRSGNKEVFDRDKLLTSVRRSVGKFFNSEMEVEQVVNLVTDKLYDLGTDEVTSKQVGEAILEVLAEVNEVAYVRFASVFREFRSLDEFEKIIREQREQKAQKVVSSDK